MTPEIVEFGSDDVYWGQDNCERCGAWLAVMPHHHEERKLTRVPSDISSFTYVWPCGVCGAELRYETPRPPGTHSPDPNADTYEPGTFPPENRWELDRELVDRVSDAAARYAAHVTDQQLQGVPSLLDHEGVRHTSWGTITGDTADPTGIRRSLAALRAAAGHRDAAWTSTILAEWAVLRTDDALRLLRNQPDLDFVREQVDLDFDAIVDVGPVLGHGDDSAWGRFEPWRRANRLQEESYDWLGGRETGTWFRERIEVAERILLDYRMMRSADSRRELESDRANLIKTARRWANALSGEL